MGGSRLYGSCLSLALYMVLRLEAGLRELRAAIVRVVWSRHQSLANPGPVLSLLDGPTGCDPAFCVLCFGSICSAGFLPTVLVRFLGCVGCLTVLLRAALVMVLLTCLWKAPLRLDLFGLLNWLVGFGMAYRFLSNLAGPIQHFPSAVLEGWRSKVSADLCAKKGFRGGSLVDIDGTLQLLNSGHVRERNKALLRSILVGGVWNGFLLQKVKGSAGALSIVWACWQWWSPFWESALFHLQLRFVKILSFMISWRWICRLGLGACFDMVGCLFFLGRLAGI